MAPRHREKLSASLVARDDGCVRLAVVADTHSAPHPRTMDRLAEIAPDAILHAGDIGDLAVLDALAKQAPVFAVRGNVDGRDRPDVLVLDVRSAERPLVRILVTHIAVDGPRLRADVARMAHAEDASLVVCGHSHVPLVATQGDVTVFNPGSIGPRRFRLPIVLGTIDIAPTGIQLAHVDAETGRPWTPRAP